MFVSLTNCKAVLGLVCVMLVRFTNSKFCNDLSITLVPSATSNERPVVAVSLFPDVLIFNAQTFVTPETAVALLISYLPNIPLPWSISSSLTLNGA